MVVSIKSRMLSERIGCSTNFVMNEVRHISRNILDAVELSDRLHQTCNRRIIASRLLKNYVYYNVGQSRAQFEKMKHSRTLLNDVRSHMLQSSKP